MTARKAAAFAAAMTTAAMTAAFAAHAAAGTTEADMAARVAALAEKSDAAEEAAKVAEAEEADAAEDDGAETDGGFPNELVFFGDSRVVGMGMYAPAEGCAFVGETGAGYGWMSGEGAAALESALAAAGGDAGVVFCFGVNDLGDADLYASWFENWTADRPETEAWFSAVWPVDDAAAEACGYYVCDAQTDAFDDVLAARLGGRFLDVDDEIARAGFYAPDGVHYDAATYAYVREAVREAAEGSFGAR